MISTTIGGKCELYLIPPRQRVESPSDLNGFSPLEGTVPGNVEIDMQRAGIIEDPFYGNNVLKLRQYERWSFWYVLRFWMNAKQMESRPELKFNGVDTVASYFLNGKKLGESCNMLCSHSFPISGYAAEGENVLAVKLSSPIEYADGQEYYPYMVSFPLNFSSTRIRKAPHMYGWDIMPRMLSAGIWRDIELVEHQPCEIKDVYFATLHLEEDAATLWFYYELDLPADWYHRAKVRLTATCKGQNIEYEETVHFKCSTARIRVESPNLWWPRGYGQANLYSAQIELRNEEGGVLDQKQVIFGIRKVEITRGRPSEESASFQIRVNGERILCKGTNWVPADALHSRDRERLPLLLEAARDLGCNIIRCWGGNVYENDCFFEYCDRHGIMVWQDIAMACNMYPTDDNFQAVMQEEVRCLSERVRNHACLILYCGDNECDWGFMMNEMDPEHNVVTRRTLPEELFRRDPFREYLPSSPYVSPSAFRLRSQDRLEENHLWGARDNFKSDYYSKSECGFIGEIGYHGCPNVSGIERFLSPSRLWPWQGNDEWITHCTSPDGAQDYFAYRLKLMNDQIGELFGIECGNLNEFALASQISQAEALKYFIETVRICKWQKSGIIWWNLWDGWPQFSDAIVDYYGGKKLAYHYVKRSQREITVIMEEPKDWYCAVTVANDTRKSARGSVTITDADTGGVIFEAEFLSPANENRRIGRIPVSAGTRKLFLIRAEVEGESVVNHYLHGNPPFDLSVYQKYLGQIAALDGSFDAGTVAK